MALIIYQHQEFANKDGNHVLGNGGNVRGKHQPKMSRSDLRQNTAPTHQKEKIKLDFIVAGFPKCGTTTLLHSFLKHNKSTIAPGELAS